MSPRMEFLEPFAWHLELKLEAPQKDSLLLHLEAPKVNGSRNSLEATCPTGRPRLFNRFSVFFMGFKQDSRGFKPQEDMIWAPGSFSFIQESESPVHRAAELTALWDDVGEPGATWAFQSL